jgi:peptide/nickel transport system substrate-binding protein
MTIDKELQWLAGIKGMPRREFIQRAAALGISASTASSMLTRSALAQRSPQKGGDLVLGIDGAGAGDSLDPQTYTATYMHTIAYQWGNCLTELDENNQVIPELAESWEPDEQATSWVFKLRRGIEFHNGREMTAEDVVYSINLHRGADSTSGAQGYLQPITDVRATAPNEVTLVLDAPNADVPYVVSDYHLVIMPKDADPAAAIGTGAFIIEAFEPGVRTFARRNPNYWKEGRGHVDTVETLAINDLTARTSALQTGQVHFINRLDPKTVALLQRAPGIKVHDVPGAGHYTFPMRADTPPFDNNDARLALKYAIDREEIVDKILRGHGKIGNDHPIPEFDPFYAVDLPQRAYDPDKAKFHLQQSGHEGPLTLFIADAAFTGAVDAATLYQQHAQAAGIDLVLQRVPEDGYWSETWMQKPFVGSYWGGRPTADLMLSVAYQSDAAWNESFWRREDFDKLLKEARGTLDFEKRKEMYAELQRMIWEDGGEVIPMYNNYLLGAQENLYGFVEAPVLTGLRVAEQVWFE